MMGGAAAKIRGEGPVRLEPYRTEGRHSRESAHSYGPQQ